MTEKTDKQNKQEGKNPMEKPFIEKLTINISVGEAGEKLDHAKALLERITGKKTILTKAKRRIPSFGIRPGLPIGVKVTIRGKEAEEMLKKLVKANKNKIKKSSISKDGQVSFGIKEYIDIPGVKYDPDIGMFGMDVVITMAKPGYRVARRKIARSRIGKRQRVKPEETVAFLQSLGVDVAEDTAKAK